MIITIISSRSDVFLHIGTESKDIHKEYHLLLLVYFGLLLVKLGKL